MITIDEARYKELEDSVLKYAEMVEHLSDTVNKLQTANATINLLLQFIKNKGLQPPQIYSA